MSRPPREPVRYGWIWIVYVLLYAASVPWYLPAGTIPEIWLGLPSWALLSLLSTVGIALFTVLVIRSFWDDTDPT
ncbi:MAG TPA: hypothetical protein VGC53_15695 [Vicinamibacteria bacterium]|jgi:hypothetical protein